MRLELHVCVTEQCDQLNTFLLSLPNSLGGGLTTAYCQNRVAIWQSFSPWKISRSGNPEIAFDFLPKGSTFGWCLPCHFSISEAAILSEVQQPSCEHKMQAWKITKSQPWYHPFIELKLVAACLQKSYQLRKLNSYLFNPLSIGFSVTGS